MATFCKTSKGGFNLEQVTDWYVSYKTLIIRLSGRREEESVTVPIDDAEGKRLLGILSGMCIFDSTQESTK